MSNRLEMAPLKAPEKNAQRAVQKVAHRALDHALRALVPSDGATPYRPVACATEPESFFALPSFPAELVVERVRQVRAGRLLIQRKRFAYPSPARSGVPTNDTVRGYWVTPLHRPVRASLVFLHGWKAAALRPLLRVARHAVVQGVEVFLPAHPFHAWRRPRLTYSGLPLLTPDLDRSLRAMRQAVLDARWLLEWVQRRGQGPVLLAGLDLGGLVAALTATVHEGLSGLVVIACHERLSDMLWEGQADRGRFRRAMEHARVQRESLDQAWSVLDPGWRAPRLPSEKILLVEGRYGEALVNASLERLAQRWGGARVSAHNFARSDFPFFSRPIMRETLRMVGLDDA